LMRNVTPGKSGFSTSRTEITHILISAVVMSIAFALLFRNRPSITAYFEYHLGNLWYVGMFAVMFVLVMLSFVGHEMGHKIAAQKYGMWSEYRMFPAGLFLSLLMSLVGFLIAAPGAVMIRGNYITQEQNGKISIAGPLVNMILAAIGFAGCMLFNHTAALVPFYLLLNLNGALALFNLLPFGPLDGVKILAWRKDIWICCVAVAAIEFFALWFMPTLYWA